MSTAPTNSPLTVHLNLGPRSYDVLIGSVANNTGAHVRKVLPNSTCAALVVDPALPLHYVDAITTSLKNAHFQTKIIRPVSTHRANDTISRHVWHSTEEQKSLDAIGSIVANLVDANLTRTDPIISLGGGILGDIAGFAAAMHRRGSPWINIPTTLLSMVDASVGGKTGANVSTSYGMFKNMIGAFHQPSLVLVDPNFLRTLPIRELVAGFAECIKHAMIAGTPSLRDTSKPANTEPDLSFSSIQHTLKIFEYISQGDFAAFNSLAPFIHANITLKARVVEQDEFETSAAPEGGRMLLNLGHTFAHAIEAFWHEVTNPLNPTSPINHGEAVALGLVAASATAAAMNLIPQSQVTALKSLLAQVPLPTHCRINPDNTHMIKVMYSDKKTAGKTLRVILPTSPSTAAVFSNPPTNALEAGWNAIRA